MVLSMMILSAVLSSASVAVSRPPTKVSELGAGEVLYPSCGGTCRLAGRGERNEEASHGVLPSAGVLPTAGRGEERRHSSVAAPIGTASITRVPQLR